MTADAKSGDRRQPGAGAGAPPGALAEVVAWGLLGIRKSSAHRADVAQVSPTTIVVAALLTLLVFVGLLVAVVRWVAAGA
jgi:hypothetical protein